MAELVWALPCNKVLLDNSGNMTIIDVMERVTLIADRDRFEKSIAHALSTGQRPLIEQPWTFVSYWVRSDQNTPETQAARLRVAPPDGGREMIVPFELDMTEAQKVRTLYPLPGLPWGGEGQVWLHVERAASGENWKTLASIPVELLLQEAPQTPRVVIPPSPAKKDGGTSRRAKKKK